MKKEFTIRDLYWVVRRAVYYVHHSDWVGTYSPEDRIDTEDMLQDFRKEIRRKFGKARGNYIIRIMNLGA